MIKMCENCVFVRTCEYKDDLQNKVDALKKKLDSYKEEINNIACRHESNTSNSTDTYADFSIDVTVMCRHFSKRFKEEKQND